MKFYPEKPFQPVWTCGFDWVVTFGWIVIYVGLLSACSFAPVRDAIGYTENKCTNMGFVKGTKEHASCQLELEMQYSRNSALKNSAWQLRNK